MCQELNQTALKVWTVKKQCLLLLLDRRTGVYCWIWLWSCGPIFSNLGLGWASYRYHCQRLERLQFTSGRPTWANNLWKLATLRKVLLQCYLVRNVICSSNVSYSVIFHISSQIEPWGHSITTWDSNDHDQQQIFHIFCVPLISVLRSGGKDLTASGAYPFQFGHRVARLHIRFMQNKHAYRETTDLQALLKAGYQDRIYAGETKMVLRKFIVYRGLKHSSVDFPNSFLLPTLVWGPKPNHSAAMQDPGDAWKFAELGSLKGVLMAAANAGKFIPDPMIRFDVEPREEIYRNFIDHYFTS